MTIRERARERAKRLRLADKLAKKDGITPSQGDATAINADRAKYPGWRL